MPEVRVDIPSSMKIALDSEVVRTKGSPSSVVIAALAEYLGTPVHTVFQVSTSRALVAGVYSGVVRVQAILDHGDFGLGTFANLDGEMVVVDGRVYHVQGTGRVSEAPTWVRTHLTNSLMPKRLTRGLIMTENQKQHQQNGAFI